MKISEIKLIQQHLKAAALYSGRIDGKRGEKTDAAVQAALSGDTARLPDAWPQWPRYRKIVAYLQILCHDHDIDAGDVDGLYGPQTETASDRLRTLNQTGRLPRGFGDIQPVRENPHNFPVETWEGLTDYFGPPCEIPLVRITCPWELRLDWDLSKTTRRISIHEKLGHSLAGILETVYGIYGSSGIKSLGLDRYGGSFNCRKKRGSLNAWSTHAWGIAIDWFPSKNKLKWDSERASLAHPDLDPWWEAWEKEGWLSLGRAEDRDWMHIQAAKR